MSYKYCRDFLINKAFKDLRNFEFLFPGINIENETDYQMYKDLISHLKNFLICLSIKRKLTLKLW